MNKRYVVKCLEDIDTDYVYMADTAYNALTKAIYTLNVSHRDLDARVMITRTCMHLYAEHCGKTWAVRNEIHGPDRVAPEKRIRLAACRPIYSRR